MAGERRVRQRESAEHLREGESGQFCWKPALYQGGGEGHGGEETELRGSGRSPGHWKTPLSHRWWRGPLPHWAVEETPAGLGGGGWVGCHGSFLSVPHITGLPGSAGVQGRGENVNSPQGSRCSWKGEWRPSHLAGRRMARVVMDANITPFFSPRVRGEPGRT